MSYNRNDDVWMQAYREDVRGKIRRANSKARRRRKLTLSRVILLQRALPRGPMGPPGPCGPTGMLGEPGFPRKEEWEAFLQTYRDQGREGYASNT